MAKSAGVVKVKRGAQLLPVEEGTTFKPGGNERTTVMANGAISGYSEKPSESELSLTLSSRADFDVEAMAASPEDTYRVFFDTGEVWSFTGWVAEPPEASDDGGGWSVSVKGGSATKIAP